MCLGIWNTWKYYGKKNIEEIRKMRNNNERILNEHQQSVL